MKKIGSQIRETLKESGYTLVKKTKTEAILKDKDDGNLELWAKNDHHAGYTISINGVGYEYVRRVKSTRGT